MPVPIRESAAGIDLSARILANSTVVASPAAAAETIIGSITLTGDLAITSGIWICTYMAATVGTSGVSAQLRIRRTNVAGTVVLDSGATTQAAASLFERSPMAFDPFLAANGQVYVLTLQVASAAAASTVSAVQMVLVAV